MIQGKERQCDRAIALLMTRGMVRLSEFTEAGITAATISRMEQKGELIRLARGLYQLPDAPLDANHALAEAAKLIPDGIVCLESALAFHELIDRIPTHVWMAIGPKDWRPQIAVPPIRTVRFGPKVFGSGIEEHEIEGVPVRIFGAAKSIVDEFRHARKLSVLYDKSRASQYTTAIGALRNALNQRKATPAEISQFALEAGSETWTRIVKPYLEALTVHA